eukprot:SAG11_NODE_1995_length_3950_cov_42.467151_1_plen_638_part_00
MTLMKVVVMVPLFALFCVGGASKSVDVVSPGLKQMWEHFDKKVSSLENELQKVSSLENEVQEEKQLRMSMQGQIDSLTSQFDSLTSQFDSLVKQNKEQQTQIDQCTCDLAGSHLRRRNQEQQSSVCGREAVQSMLGVCCASDSPGNGHRLQEIEGCDTLPPTCSLECSSQFISIFENCQEEPLMEGLTAEDMDEWNEFYTDCSEVHQSAAEMGALQPVNVRMFRIMISSDAPQSQSAMFGNGGSSPAPPLGPLPPISDGNTACWSGAYTVERCCDVTRGPTGDMSCWSGSFDFEFCCPSPVSPPLPAPSPDSSSTDLEQYHAQCTTQNILTCVPSCNTTTHGYELLATIDGTDTKFSCNLANMLFSWVGAAALGGFLGRNVQAFVSAVISGAAGTYVLTLVEDADVGTDLVVQPGQNVIISGDVGLAEAPRWGSGHHSFVVQEFGSLTLQWIRLPLATLGSAVSAFIEGAGGTLSFATIIVPERPRWGEMTGSITSQALDDVLARQLILDPPGLPLPGLFKVRAGDPCEVLQGGLCVGRWPRGYLPMEECQIEVIMGGALGPCPVWDMYDGGDHLTTPDGVNRSPNCDGCDCPVGMQLETGQRLRWISNEELQGGDRGGGLPSSRYGAGGGWQICFD